MGIVPTELAQLFVSIASATPLGPSAQAWRTYVPARVSPYTLKAAAAGVMLCPAGSAGVARPVVPDGFLTFFLTDELVFTRKNVVTEAGASSLPWFLITAVSISGSPGRAWAGGLGTEVTTRSALLCVVPCTVTVPGASAQLLLSSVSAMTLPESAQTRTVYVPVSVSE